MLSPQEVEQFRSKYSITPATEQLASAPSYLKRVTTGLKKEGLGIGQSIIRGSELMRQGKPVQGALRAGLGPAAGAVRAAFTPVTEAVSPLISPVIQKLASFVGEKNIMKVQDWAKAHPDAAANLKDVFDIGTTIVGAKGVSTGAKATSKAGKSVISSIPKPPPGTGKSVTGAIQQAGQFVENTVAEGSRIPSRMSTNLAERTAKQSTIKSLPGRIAQKAAQDGIDPNDVKFLYKIPKDIKASAKELSDTARKFSKGSTKTNPIEVVGRPIVQRLKDLETSRGKVGEKLGKVADKLGNVSSEELMPVFEELRKVPGLSGLTNEGGKLNFSNTTLATSLTKSDRKAIQDIFVEAVKPGSGKSKHLLRQELFEVLGGKKRALQSLTDTQDKAFQAVRSGLSTVLEGKNSTYKSLSNQYRKVMQPLSDMRKMMKGVAGADDDILDMSAGLLARRLTSNAGSNPQIRSILRALDKATSVKGKTQVSVESLQDFYNILDKYYDIAGKTGFQGQVRAGIENATGLGDFALKLAKGAMGETPAVRQKALESILKEVLK